MNSAIVHFARLQETPSQCALALCHAVFPVLRLPALRPPASQCAPILTRMSVLLQGGRFCQSVVHCVFCTISTDFSSSEALCFISLTLAACPDLWILQSVKFAFWTLRRQGLVRRLFWTYSNNTNILLLGTGLRQDLYRPVVALFNGAASC